MQFISSVVLQFTKESKDKFIYRGLQLQIEWELSWDMSMRQIEQKVKTCRSIKKPKDFSDLKPLTSTDCVQRMQFTEEMKKSEISPDRSNSSDTTILTRGRCGIAYTKIWRSVVWFRVTNSNVVGCPSVRGQWVGNHCRSINSERYNYSNSEAMRCCLHKNLKAIELGTWLLIRSSFV